MPGSIWEDGMESSSSSSSFFSRGRGGKTFSLLIAAGLASGFLSVKASAQQPGGPAATPPSSQQAAPGQVLSAEERQKREEWQQAISQKPVPKKGCFDSSYPSLEWREVPCGPPSKDPNRPLPRADVLANSDVAAVVVGPMISSATGRFESVTPAGVTITGPYNGINLANAFTLQLNSQFFTTAACAGVAGCTGWQQFIYSQNQCGGPCVFVEYWLLNFGAKCPMGQPWIQSGNDCWFNSNQNHNAPAVTAAQLQGTTLTGTAGAAQDTVVLTSPAGNANATANSSVLGLSLQWNTAEFNIFGDCCSSETSFSPGTTVVTRTLVSNGTDNAPTCQALKFTAETNNLSFGPAAPPQTGPGPAVIFTMSSAGGSPVACAAAQEVGDTHLTTFDGLLYDFQATGDFLLVEDRPNFVVQSRHVPTPDRPNIAINRAVATQMGNTRVAVCLGETQPLEVDGQPRDLGDGKSLPLPDGVIVSRRGNVYLIKNQSGDFVRATLNNGLIDVSVGLGYAPRNVRGLLANPGHNVHQIETRDGQVFDFDQVTFSELYGKYGESWRVPSKQSLLCGEKTIEGNPAKPEYPDGSPQFKLGRDICKAAGVNERLVESCTLDVTVLADSGAAEVFRHARPPVEELRPRYP
jgi:hypothetical protein